MYYATSSIFRSIAALAIGAYSSALYAQASPQAAPTQIATAAGSQADTLRAARLTFLAGSVRIERGDDTGEETAVLNMPLPAGTRIVTADYGQAELEFEDGSVARLAPNSSLVLSDLSLDTAQIAHSTLTLLGGLSYFELRKSSAYSWRVEAGGVTLQPLENLSLRLAFDTPTPVFALFTGAARLAKLHGFETDLRAGESVQPDKSDDTRYFLSNQIAAESWDAWNENRDQAAADAADRRTVARDEYAGQQGYGWSDLDSSGSWYDTPAGQVWQPYNADEGFDPYGYGSWVWGNGSYVWASGYNWGWTPFRCGHWEYFPGFGWGWTPDASCGLWGFAGGGYSSSAGYAGGGSGVLIRGAYPPRHPIVIRPEPRPGQPHPVIPVRGPDGPRPPTIHRGQVRIAGNTATALPFIASSVPRSAGTVGMGLARDFPIDRRTRQPILGVQNLQVPADARLPGNSSPVNRAPRGLATPNANTPATGTQVSPRSPGAASPREGTPMRPSAPAQIQPSSPPSRPAPQPYTPPPSPPPVRSAPPPPPPAPAPAPSRPAPSSPRPAD